MLIKPFKEYIKEHSLSRVYNFFNDKNKQFFILTAFRSDRPYYFDDENCDINNKDYINKFLKFYLERLELNLQMNEKLRNKLNELNYGYFPVLGFYEEKVSLEKGDVNNKLCLKQILLNNKEIIKPSIFQILKKYKANYLFKAIKNEDWFILPNFIDMEISYFCSPKQQISNLELYNHVIQLIHLDNNNPQDSGFIKYKCENNDNKLIIQNYKLSCLNDYILRNDKKYEEYEGGRKDLAFSYLPFDKNIFSAGKEYLPSSTKKNTIAIR